MSVFWLTIAPLQPSPGPNPWPGRKPSGSSCQTITNPAPGVAAISKRFASRRPEVSRSAFLLYILFLQLASAHHILVDPGISSEWKVFNTSYAMYLAVLASMIHGLTVPGSMEVAQRAKGLTKGMFEWLRKAPWGNPVFSGFFFSLIIFGFIGGITGVVMGTEQINIIIHNTIYVPALYYYVQGQVKSSGRFPYEDNMTVLMAVTTAGGFTDKASPRSTHIIRERDGRKAKVKVSLDDRLQPGDVIVVPESWF